MFFLITSIFIEWPLSYKEALWTQKNGQWVRSTKPVFHTPFSFGGYRETTSNNNRYDATSEPFILKHTEQSVPVLTRLTVTTAADYSLMQTFCEHMGLTIQLGDSARRGRTLIEKRLNQFIKVATQSELIDPEGRQKALSDIFKEYGMEVVEIGLSTD